MNQTEKGVMFGDVLRSLREQQGLSQNKMARRAGMEPTTVNRIEKNRQGFPRTGTVIKLCTGLGYEVSDEPCQQLLLAANAVPILEEAAAITSKEQTPEYMVHYDEILAGAEFKIQDALYTTQKTLMEALQEVQRLRAEIRENPQG